MIKEYQPHVGCDYFVQRCQFMPSCKCMREEKDCKCEGDMRQCTYFGDIMEKGRKEELAFVQLSEKEGRNTHFSRQEIIEAFYNYGKEINITIPTWVYEVIERLGGKKNYV